MTKITTYLMVMTGVMLLFHLAGLIEVGSTTNSALLTLVLNPENMQNSTFAVQIVGIISGAALVGAVLIGFAVKDFTLTAKIAFVTFLFNIGWDFLVVFNVVAAQNRVIAVLLFGPILVMFMMSTIEWFTGQG